MMNDYEFIKKINNSNLEDVKDFLDKHSLNYVLDLLIRNNKIDSNTLDIICNYYNDKISSNNANRLINMNLLDITNLPDYMYKEDVYLQSIFNKKLNLDIKYKLIDILINYDTLTEYYIRNIIGTNEIDDNYNTKIYSDIKYTKVLANINCLNGYHFKKSGINNEVVDILLNKNIKYNKKYDECDLYKDYYFVINCLNNDTNILSYINKNYSDYNENEVLQILNSIINKYKDDNFFEFINHDAKLINTWLDNSSSLISVYINKISDNIIKDENNGVVKKFIDLGLYFNNSLNPIILSSEIYVNYKLDKDIEKKNNLSWIQCIGSNLLDNPDNGIVNKAIKNGCYFFDIFFNHTEYINEYIENNKVDSNFYNRIPKNIINEPSNNVIFKLLEKGYISFQTKPELFNIKEYLIYYIEHINENDRYSINKVLNNCDINIIIENNLFEKCVQDGYEITNNTPKEILSNPEFIYYYCDYISNYESLNNKFNVLFKLLSDDIINDVSNGIILNIIRKGYRYDKLNTDKRIISKKEYVLEFILYQDLYYNKQMLDNMPSNLLNDMEIVIQCIEMGYSYDDKTPKELYNVDYLKKYFMYYNGTNPIWLKANYIFEKIDSEVLNNKDNGLVYSAIDYGYDINQYSPSIIKNNVNYVLYFLKNNLNKINNVFKILKKENISFLSDDSFLYSLIDCGYKLTSSSPNEMLSNYNCVLYALKYGKVEQKFFTIDRNMIDYDIALLLLKNEQYLTRVGELYEKYNLSDEYLIASGSPWSVDSEIAEFISKNKSNISIDLIPDKFLQSKDTISILIHFLPNVIDYVELNILDKDLISYALINKYEISNIERLTKYINIIGLKEFIKYNPNIIEYYSEKEFKDLFNQEYEDILIYSIDNGYDIKKNISNLPKNLNNKEFILLAVKYNYVDIINFIDFDIDIELFEQIWTKNLNITMLNENIKNKIINDNELFNIVLKSDSAKLIKSISLFYPNYVSNKNIDLLLDKVLIGYKISDKNLFKNNLAYLYSKNKEIFYDLNIEILTDKYLFLGIETINRIIPDKSILNNVLRLDTNSLKIFNLCINYLYSIDVDVNINDILYKILSNLTIGKFDNMCSNILNGFVNFDELVNNISNGKTKGNNVKYIDNLISVLCIKNNMYGIESIEDVNKLLEKKNQYFDELKLDNDIDNTKENILYKYYNIDLETATFIYNRYCYIKSDIEYISDNNLRKILYDIIYLIECNDMDMLLNIYNNVSIENVNFKYSIMLEGLLRNEYVKQYNSKLDSNTLVPIDDNIFELENDINLFVHVLGAYNRRYVDPINYKDAWNIELMTNHGICTSYITNQNLSTSRNVYNPTLVFSEIEDNSILLASPDDIVSNNLNQMFATSMMKPCCFLTPDTMIDETRWQHNEIVLERKNLSNNKINYKRLPNYVLYMIEAEYIDDNDEIIWEKIKSTELWKKTEKASKDFDIPILVINKVKINKREVNVIDEMKQELFATNNISLINKIIVRYMNNIMDSKNIIKVEDLYNFMDNIIDLSFELENGIEILEMLYYSVINENRKFNDHKSDNKFNYLSKYEPIIKDKIDEYKNSTINQNDIKI